MKVYASDEEQLKALSKWWQENKQSTLRFVITLLLAASIYNLYRYNEASSSQIASTMYYNIVASVEKNDLKLAKSQIITLQNEHASSNYAALSSMILAKTFVDEGLYGDAIRQLDWVTEYGDASLHDIAYMRIARLNLALNKPHIALSSLAKIKNNTSEKSLVEGDSYMQLQKTTEAKEAYKKAMKSADKSKVYELWELASMKYNSLKQ